MVEIFPTRVWTRDQWQKERDKAGVPKGATKVNMGEAIGRFHKANAKGVREGVPAAQRLQKDIQTYKAGVRQKYKAWHDRVERMLEIDVNAYVADAAKLASAAHRYQALHTAATNEVRQLGAEFIHWRGAGARGTFRPSNEKAANTVLGQFVDVVRKMPYYTDKITKGEVRTFDKTVYAASGGAWSRPTVEGLMKQMASFPGSV